MATKKLSKITAWSYSRLALYEKCPRLHKYRNIEKRSEPKAPAMLNGITVHNEAAKFLSGETDIFPISCEKFMDLFYEMREFHPLVEQQWAFNKNWRATGWFDKKTWVRVIADAAIMYDDGTADIIDHKTGKRYDGDYREQMGLFAGAMMKKFGNLTHVTTRLWYLDSGDEVIEEFTKAQAMAILETLQGNAQLMMNATRFPPQPNWTCKWCHFRAANGGPCEY